MNYRADHIKVLEFLAKDLPKKTAYKVADIAKAKFSNIKASKPETNLDPDRACRNALRKPRKEGHIEICERGEYRLTATGAAFCKKLSDYSVAPERRSDEAPVKTKGDKKSKKEDKKGDKKNKKVDKKSKKAKKAEEAVVEDAAVEESVEEKPAKKTKKAKKAKKSGLRIPRSKKEEARQESAEEPSEIKEEAPAEDSVEQEEDSDDLGI